MTALDARARRKGRKAMEKTLTAAGRVRRRFKAGAKARMSDKPLSLLEGLYRLASDADKARNLMREENLDPDDIQCALMYSAAELVGAKRLPAPKEVHKFFRYFEELGDVRLLGTIWKQQDRDPDAKESVVAWVTPFTFDTKAQKQMFYLRDQALKGVSFES